MTLDEKIKTRQTELQMAYDDALEEIRVLEEEIMQRYEKIEKAKELVLRCKVRASEQGVSHIL